MLDFAEIWYTVHYVSAEESTYHEIQGGFPRKKNPK